MSVVHFHNVRDLYWLKISLTLTSIYARSKINLSIFLENLNKIEITKINSNSNWGLWPLQIILQVFGNVLCLELW